MLPALSLRLRASCLTRRRVEPLGLLQRDRRALTIPPFNRKKPKQEKEVRRARVKKTDNPSLLEELFPEEAQRHNERPAAEKEVPRLKLEVSRKPDALAPDSGPPRPHTRKQPELPLDKAAFWASNRDTKRLYARLERQGDFTSIVVLRNASKNLTEEDFRRVIPQGKHIEGWNLERGDIVKVIPGRDSSTLERLNFYLILFKSPVSAFAYQTHVTRLHKIAQSQTPSSLLSPVPPPPGYTVGGEDIDAMIQSYSLLPPSQKMDIRQLSPPLTRAVQQIVENEGYPPIVLRPGKMPAEVIFYLEGPQLPVPVIQRALHLAARHRGLPWTGIENQYMNIQKWEIKGTNIPLDRDKRYFKDNEKDGFDLQKGFGESEDDTRDDEASEDPLGPQRQRRTPPRRYIVGFDNDAEAEAFVRFWHRQPLELPEFEYANGDIAPIVNAEVLW